MTEMKYVHTVLVYPDGRKDIFRYSEEVYELLLNSPGFENDTTWIYNYSSGTWDEYPTNYIHREECVILEEEVPRLIVEMELTK